MLPMRCFAALVTCLLLASPLLAQKEKRDPLTEAEIKEIRDAGSDPCGRVVIYTRILNEHAETIKGLAKRAPSSWRSLRLDGELKDFTALLDDLGANLDVYSERKSDIRRGLKPLNEATQQWLAMLRALDVAPAFDLSRKEAIESGEDLAEQAKQLEAEQTEYFKVHKDEVGQERAEPK
jgi:hypothetical protein